MREYALVKQNLQEDLFAFMFYPVIDSDDIDTINVLEPEWINGSFYNNSGGGTQANANMRRCVLDCTGYDYVIAGMSVGNSNSTYSGVREDTTLSTLFNTATIKSAGGLVSAMVVFQLFYGTILYPVLFLSQAIDKPLPIIGIKLKSSGGAKNADDDMRSDETPAPDPDEVKGEPAEPEPEPEPEPELEPETRSTKKK